MSSPLPQLEVLAGTLRRAGELLVQRPQGCSSLRHCQVRRGGHRSSGEIFFTAAWGRWQGGVFFRGDKKATSFINDKGDNLRHWYWLYCLSSEQLVDIGVSAVLLHPLSSLAQACNTRSMKKCQESPSKNWRGFLHFSSFSVMYRPLLLNL